MGSSGHVRSDVTAQREGQWGGGQLQDVYVPPEMANVDSEQAK